MIIPARMNTSGPNGQITNFQITKFFEYLGLAIRSSSVQNTAREQGTA